MTASPVTPIPLDCIVVGYNDPPFDGLLRRAEVTKSRSGGYRHLLVNSVPVGERRLKYAQLLNLALETATGKPSQLHVAKMPNLGVCYLTSFLRRRGYRAEIVNFFNDERDTFAALLAERPHCVAVTTTFYFESHPIREIVDFVRQHSPTTRVVVGGPHIFNVCSDHPILVQDTLLREMGADIYVHDSQGELTLSHICAALREANPDLSKIPNLVYAEDNKRFHRNTRVAESNDLNAEVVDWSTFDRDFLVPTVQTRTARSCAYKCAFCRYPIMAGSLDLAGLDVIEREMEVLHAIGARQVLFIDDTFNIPLNRFKEICRMMIRRRFNFRWFSYFRCANADLEAFDLMAESGCAGVFLGIESGDDRVLKAMNKVATADKYRVGIARLRERKILTYASFIVGHPGETDVSARNTIRFIEETRPDFYCLEAFFFDPKVPIGAKAPEYGLTGSGYAWSHNTMDWMMAADLVEEGYRSIGSSIVVPLYGFDLWSLAYLLGKGVTFDQLTTFLREAATLLIGTSRDASVDALERRLASAFEPAGAF
jgi:p-methyltransferase